MAIKVQCRCGRSHWLASAQSQAICPCGQTITAATQSPPESPPQPPPELPPQQAPEPPQVVQRDPKPPVSPPPARDELTTERPIAEVAAERASYDLSLRSAGPDPAALIAILQKKFGLSFDASMAAVKKPYVTITQGLSKQELDDLRATLEQSQAETSAIGRIRVQCTNCSAVFRVKQELAGKSGPCGKCSKTFTITTETILPFKGPEPKPAKEPPAGGTSGSRKPPSGTGTSASKKPGSPKWEAPIHRGGSISGPLVATASGYHFQLLSDGWQRFSLEEEQESHSEVLARSEHVGAVECSTMPWKLDFEDLFAGVHEVYRKNTPHFRLLGKTKTIAGGLPAIIVEYEGIPRGATCQLRYVALAVLTQQQCAHVIVAGPEELADTIRNESAAVAATFSPEPLPPDRAAQALPPSAERLEEKKPVVRETDDGKRPHKPDRPQRPQGKYIEGAEFMAALLLRGVFIGMAIALPVTLVLAVLAGELFVHDPGQMWSFRLWVFFLSTSYFGALAIGMVLNRRMQKAHGPKISGSAGNFIGKLIGYFIGLGLLGVQETAKVFFRLLGMLFRGGAQANRQAFITFMLAAGIYGTMAGTVIIRTAIRWNATPMSQMEMAHGKAGILYQQGQEAHTRNKHADAVKLLTEAIADSPDWDSPYITRGSAYREMGDFDKALVDLNKAIALGKSQNHVAFFARGYTHAKQHDDDRAMADYTKAIQLCPTVHEAYNNRGNLYVAKFEYDLALADYSEAIKLHPEAMYYRNRGWEHLRRLVLPQALSDMQEAVKRGPREPESLVGRAAVQMHMHQHDRAIADCNSAIGFKTDCPGAYRYRGQSYFLTGRLDLAVADLSKSVELSPNDAPARGLRALVLLAQGKSGQAVDDANKCVELSPKSADAYLVRARIRNRMLDFPAAIADCAKAIELSPRNAPAFVERSLALTEMGDQAKAMDDANTGMKLCDADCRAYCARAIAHCARGAYDEALPDAEQALKLDPRDASAMSIRAMAKSGNKDQTGAAADCDKAMAAEPWNSFHYMVRASVRLARNDATKAIADANKALGLNRYEAWALYYRGMAQAKSGNKAAAIADLTAVQELDKHGRAGREAKLRIQQLQPSDPHP